MLPQLYYINKFLIVTLISHTHLSSLLALRYDVRSNSQDFTLHRRFKNKLLITSTINVKSRVTSLTIVAITSLI